LRSVALIVALALAATAVGGAECPEADPEALKWLDRMSRSLRETSYQGVFTYQYGGSVQTMRIVHSVRGNIESEQLTRLTGPSARVVRAEHPLDCVHPGHRLVRIGRLYRGEGEDCGVSDHYRLQMAGSRRIAGRESVLMNILPRDIYRYGYQIALDTATGLLLQTQTIAQNGQVLERFQFADVEFGEVNGEGSHVEVIHKAAHRHGGDRPPAPSNQAPWTVRWLPDGFMLTGEVDETGHDKTYTDGLATFTVFVEAVPQMTEPGAGQASQGGTTAYTRGLLISGKPALVTVLGEVPVNTARRVVDSVVWVQASPR
jgi:sigma-E factor negative regulatory protein RseB